MPHAAMARTGGRLLVDALRLHGADLVFGVPGESYLEVLDALVDAPEIRYVVGRQEGGVAFMAEAYGKLTGRPGIAFVTRGPGACNAAIGVHTAFQDSAPMILFIGQVARDQAEREAFQEIDYRRMFGPVAKWVAEVNQAARLPELVAHAFHVATSGRPGPVVLALPEDMLREMATVGDGRRYAVTQAHPGAADMAALAGRLMAAERPLVLVGGGGWSDAAAAGLRAFAEAWRLPVAGTFRRLDLLGNDSPSYVGELGIGPNPALVERVRQADLLLVVGARLGEMTTQGYRLLGTPAPRQDLIHVHAAAEELGRVFQPVLGLVAGPEPMAAALAALPAPATPRWAAWTAAARADHGAWSEPEGCVGALDLAAAMGWLRRRLPADAIVTTDAGNFAHWCQRFLSFGRPGRYLGPTNGAMGYGVPAAVTAKLVHPDRLVVGFVGDGGFQMTGQELATARQSGAAPVLLVFNNGLYGTIRMHQERRYPGRVSGTTLVNPDFAALARAHGAFGQAVERTEDFAPAFEAAVASGTAAVLDLRTDPEQITTRATIDALRAEARAGHRN